VREHVRRPAHERARRYFTERSRGSTGDPGARRRLRNCADRRDAKGQMSLFTTDTRFVVYINAKSPARSQELHSRLSSQN
jgi:hypothetical protein